MSGEERFKFGRNWHNFIKKQYSEDRLDDSKVHLLDMLNLESLEGLRFLDIGCGSGLHSLAAVRSGAAEVQGFDYDEESVAASSYLRELHGGGANWEISRGDVLDAEYMAGIEPADIVYSWGVLHHTGDVWTAVRNAAKPVKPNGLFYIALYSSDVHSDPPPEFWLDVKKKYVSSTPLQQFWMMLWYLWRFEMGKNILRAPKIFWRAVNPRKRGMSYLTDVRDWIGGWPMEFVGDQEAVDFVEKELGMKLLKMLTGEANTEFVFRNEA